jgi:hypothetical protein
MHNVGPEFVKAELLKHLDPVALNVYYSNSIQFLKTSIAEMWRKTIIMPALKANNPAAELSG